LNARLRKLSSCALALPFQTLNRYADLRRLLRYKRAIRRDALFAAEPQNTNYDLNFRVVGVPVRVHPWFWLMTLLLGAQGVNSRAGVGYLFMWVLVVFVSILIHELGHVAAFRFYGIRSHVVLYQCGGLAVADSQMGWLSGRGTRHRGYAGDALIAFAGPLAGFVFAAFAMGIVYLAGYQVVFSPGYLEQLEFKFGNEPIPDVRIDILVNMLLFVNIFWGLINLLPVHPLDGGQIARAALTAANPSEGVRQSLMLSVGAGAGVALLAAVKWEDWYIALFFGYLAYLSYTALQQISDGYGGGREW
jgi:Zn-dependent protease